MKTVSKGAGLRKMVGTIPPARRPIADPQQVDQENPAARTYPPDYGFTHTNEAAALMSPAPLYRAHFG